MQKKILGLELLRGLCAVLVAIFHCLTWSNLATLPTWGLYTVYVFFGISGAVLWQNYHATLGAEVTLASFMWRRFARLVPLVAACIILPQLLQNSWEPARTIINVALLSGFIAPGATSYLIGQWSLGIEVVLYALFPMLLAFTMSWRIAAVVLAVLITLRMVFISIAFDGVGFNAAWPIYVQPGAFLCFFFGGMLIAKAMSSRGNSVLLGIAGCAGMLLLFAFPGESMEGVLLGARGLALTLLSIAVVALFYWSPKARIAAVVCAFFGDISYGMYLLHPFAWRGLAKLWPAIPVAERLIATLLLSAIAAWISLRFYERPVRRWLLR